VWVSAYPRSRAYCPQIQYYYNRKPQKLQYLFGKESNIFEKIRILKICAVSAPMVKIHVIFA
jgi:hypothetical protein